ncbi:MAG TPA: tripartite tricarboxylate transporter substrate binding protein [Eoetvoesiella sp.]
MNLHFLRRILLASLLAGTCTAVTASPADGYPSKPITIVVPYPAGGTADVLPRIVAQKLTEKWGQPVVIQNRTGAGGNIGTDYVAKASPDGYTLLVTPPAPLAINRNLYKDLPFDPESFELITVLASVPNVLAVRSDLPVNSTQEFIDYAKKEAGSVNVATQGNGTTSHLTGAMFADQAGATFTFVPYRGTAPALTDLVGGQVDVFFDNISSMHTYHKAGKAKILAVAGSSRSPLLPDVPTIAESGLPGFNATTWFGAAAPQGTPAEIVQKLNTAIVEILNMPDVKKQFLGQGAEVEGQSPKETSDFIAAERVRWKQVIDQAGVKSN